MTRRQIAAAIVVLLGGVSRSEAHPAKIDIHPADCTMKTGGALSYPGNIYIEAPPPPSYSDVVCPIPLHTEQNATAGHITMSFEVRYESKAAAGSGSTDFRCMIIGEFAGTAPGSQQTVGPNFSTSTYTAGTPLGSGILKGTPTSLLVPTDTTGEVPYQLAVHCYLTGSA